jgi:hypothetical protein
MELFEFLMVLVSIIIGLAMAELLTGSARLLRARRSVDFYWLHTLLILGIGLAMLQIWWESWHLRDVGAVSFLQLCLLLASPIALFMMAHLLFPGRGEPVVMRDYYFQQAPLIWGFALLGTLVGTFALPWASGDTVIRLNNLSGFPMIALFVVMIISKNPRVHEVAAPLVLVLLALDTVLPGRFIAG